MARCFVSASETGVVAAKTVAMRPAVTSAGFDVDGDSGGCWSVGHGLIVGDGGIWGINEIGTAARRQTPRCPMDSQVQASAQRVNFLVGVSRPKSTICTGCDCL